MKYDLTVCANNNNTGSLLGMNVRNVTVHMLDSPLDVIITHSAKYCTDVYALIQQMDTDNRELIMAGDFNNLSSKVLELIGTHVHMDKVSVLDSNRLDHIISIRKKTMCINCHEEFTGDDLCCAACANILQRDDMKAYFTCTHCDSPCDSLIQDKFCSARCTEAHYEDYVCFLDNKRLDERLREDCDDYDHYEERRTCCVCKASFPSENCDDYCCGAGCYEDLHNDRYSDSESDDGRRGYDDYY